MRRLLDSHSLVLENVNGERGIGVRRTAHGEVYIYQTGVAAGARWSGLVWYLGVLKWDFSRVGAVLNGPLNDPPGITVNGMFLKIKLADGSYEWTDVFATPADTDEYSYYWVASGDSENGYCLNSHTCGDIRIEMVPWLPEEEAEEE
jgi:hypothetical protein